MLRPRLRRVALVASLMIASAIVVTVGVSLGGDGPASPANSATAPLSSYRVVYRIEDHSGRTLQVSTEELVVARPYRSRRSFWPGDDRRGRPERITVSDFGVISMRQVNSSDLTRAVRPGPASGDLRLEHTLAALAESGALDYLGLDSVLDATCDVYRTRQPLGGQLLLPATTEEWADVCVDPRGLVLSERWYLSGRLFQTRTAIEVEVNPDVAPASTQPFAPVDAPEISGTLTPVRHNSPWVVRMPESFAHRGRYELIVPTGEPDPVDPSRPAQASVSIVDVYERESDVVVVEVGPSDARIGSHENRHEIELPGLRQAWLEPTVLGYEVVVLTPDGMRVGIRTTADRQTVLHIAGTLQSSPS